MNVLEHKYKNCLRELESYNKKICELEKSTDYLEKLIKKSRKKYEKTLDKSIKTKIKSKK